MALNIELVPNQTQKPAVLLRESWREGRRIRKKTVANLSKLPPEVVRGFDAVLRGGVAVADAGDLMDIERSLGHGHVAAVLGTARKLGFERLLHRSRSRERQLALAAVVARVIAPDSKLGTARRLSPETATSSLGAMLGLGPVSGNEMLGMLDWLLARQAWIERSLARRHLEGATLILYDVTSTYLEGRCCPLAAFGHNRDGKRGKRQIVFGLLCSSEGCPVAVELFAGNTADPKTVAPQIEKIRSRFGVDRVALVGDRGMVTTARIRGDLGPAGLDWISALKAADLRRLARAPDADTAPALDPDAVPPDAVAEVAGPDFPGERLMVCLNPRLREERRRKREDLLKATEATLRAIEAAASAAKPGKANRDRTSRRIGREANRRKVEKHFRIEVREDGMSWSRDEDGIAAEAALDGIYVVRTSLAPGEIGADEAVEAYKSLSTVERAFRTVKSDLRVRPVHVYTEDHVRAHVFMCMLSYHIEWHMRRSLAPLLFEDDDREGARRARNSPVERARPSAAARRKAASKRTPDDLPVHSFRTLVDDLSTVALNSVRLPGRHEARLSIVTRPTRLQNRAFDLLGVNPAKSVPIIEPA